jgi:hypothetical protein
MAARDRFPGRMVMNMSKTFFLLLLLVTAVFPQSKPEPLDGPNRPFHDDLLDNLKGHWKVTGMLVGHPGDAELDAVWVLNHQFLEIHEKGASVMPGRQYEARSTLATTMPASATSHIGSILTAAVSPRPSATARGPETPSSSISNILTVLFTILSPGTLNLGPGVFCWSRRMMPASGSRLRIGQRPQLTSYIFTQKSSGWLPVKEHQERSIS